MTAQSRKRTLFPDQSDVKARHGALIAGSRRNSLITMAVVAGIVGLALFAILRLEFSFARLGSGIVQLGTFLSLMIPPSPGGQLSALLKALAETVAIAFLGTLLAAIISIPLGFLAARNVMTNRIVQFFSRRVSDSIRGVDTLIWALIWINVVGLGPFAGVLAIMTSDIGSFSKLYSEAIEAVDRRPSEGVVSTGGSRWHAIRFGIVPQVMPVLLSQILYYFESNTRSATIIGIVGAGGIGLYLAEMIRTYEWDKVAFIILMILVTVAVIDLISSRLRLAIVGERTGRL
ncbi:MAG: phosphonate ABC transporter, permease protein PhnE [Bosea sp. (in: a-proteobacteria)]